MVPGVRTVLCTGWIFLALFSYIESMWSPVFFVLVKTTVTKVLSLFFLVTLLSPLVCRPLYLIDLILCLVS